MQFERGTYKEIETIKKYSFKNIDDLKRTHRSERCFFCQNEHGKPIT